MDNMMENDPKTRMHLKVFQEGFSLHVHHFKLVKIVFMRNAKIFTSTFQEGDHKHATNENDEQEDVESSKIIECIVGIPKRATTS